VRLVAATLYGLEIPFVEAFRHSARERSACDSVVVHVRDEIGTEGFGEGCPRPYVTGETVDTVLRHLAEDLWPGVMERELPALVDGASLSRVDELIPQRGIAGALADNASRAALELAMVDCILRRQGISLGRLLPPRRRKLVYSGVITAGSLEKAAQHARQMKLIGLTQVKVKVGMDEDLARVRAVRGALGRAASIRVDANGAWTSEQAVAALTAMAPLDIAAVEQPLPRGPAHELRALREASPIPLMADESLVTLEDAEALIASKAVDFFNIRVSKCGGLHRSLQIAARASAAGVRVQVGSQVGETAILSAAGRHLAASLPEVAFVEGSYGTLLLAEDVSTDAIRFGHRGEAALLTGPGLGVRVLPERLRKYARRVIELPSEGP
jgi:L-Ala-D/L-Glu epimerase